MSAAVLAAVMAVDDWTTPTSWDTGHGFGDSNRHGQVANYGFYDLRVATLPASKNPWWGVGDPRISNTAWNP